MRSGEPKVKPTKAYGKNDPKPCPVCYAPMRLVNGHLECEKHGEPKRP